MDLFTIVLAEDLPLDARLYGDIVAPVLGVTKQEARIAVRRARGIFLEDLVEDDARRLVDLLAKDGIRAWALKNDELPALPHPLRAPWFLRNAGRFEHKGEGDEGRGVFEGSRILAISLGAVARPEWTDTWNHIKFGALPSISRFSGDREAAELLRENLILKLDAEPDTVIPKSKATERSIFERIEKEHGKTLNLCVDVVVRDGPWLRVPMTEVTYSREPGSVRFGDAWGFGYLVRDLVDASPAAATTMTLKFLDGVDIKPLVFLRMEDFTRYTAWSVVRRSPACAASSSPSPDPPAPSTDAGSSTSSPGAPTPSTSP